MWQTYYTPTSIDEALRLLAEHSPNARIVAGGTDLLVELQRGTRQAEVLVDVTRIGGLDRVRLENGILHVGPTVTHNLATASTDLVEQGLPLALACAQVGTPQLRNRGTITGNLVTASPANDTITALWALKGRLHLKSIRGERTLPCEEFYTGVRQTQLAPDEMVTGIEFNALKPNQRGTFVKLALRHAHAIALVNVAAVLTFDEAVVTHARITLGSVAPTIIRAKEAEANLVGAPLSDERIAEAAHLAVQATACITDVRSGCDYREHLSRVLVERALTQLRDDTAQTGFPGDQPHLWGSSDGHYPRLAGKTIRHRREGPEPIECSVNGQNVVVQGAGGKTLLAMLRDDLGLTGSKEGCGEGECGACTVWLDGIAVLGCLTPAPRAHGAHVVTIEGLAEDDEHLHPVQQAFIDAGAVQCGYCTPGFVMAGANLLQEIPEPTREQIVAGLTGNLCRCTGYYKIIEAIEQASGQDE